MIMKTKPTLRELIAAATPGPYFVSHDCGQKAADFLAHSGSGLAIVDTGRGEDWPIARFCEWPQAQLIARMASPEVALKVLEALEGANGFAIECQQNGLRYDFFEDVRAALQLLNALTPEDAP